MKVIFLILIVATFQIYAQSEADKRCPDGDYRVDVRKPSAFIEFERYETKDESSGSLVFLRITNNTKGNLYLNTLGADELGSRLQVSYEVRWRPSILTTNDPAKPPKHSSHFHRSNIRKLESGKSLLFSVPREHLAGDLAIFLNFSYEWEILGYVGGDLSVSHQAPYWGIWLPK